MNIAIIFMNTNNHECLGSDPLTAVGLAGTVVQFVDFSTKLVSHSVELYEKGKLSCHDELEKATVDLTQLTQELSYIPQASQSQPGFVRRRPSREEVALEQLAASCAELGGQLLSVLNSLNAQKSHNCLESFRTALRAVRKKSNIEDIDHRLKKLKDQLCMRLLAILR
jgi:hypothetical protein